MQQATVSYYLRANAGEITQASVGKYRFKQLPLYQSHCITQEKIMATTTKKPRVLIIGGGLGGLAFAQSLRKKGIPYLLFERDSSDGARSQGWAISLHDW